MRCRAEADGLSVHAIAGTHVVLFGMDVPRDRLEGLLGFAISRRISGHDAVYWLPNFLRFEANKSEPGASLSSDNPFQAFVWGDYTVSPGAKLAYRVEARYGTPQHLETRAAVELDVKVEPEDDGAHGIWFNRGAAGSQRYSEKFRDKDPRTDAEARKWLSRGLEEALRDFVAEATHGDALRGAFYEFHHRATLDELAAAVARGVDVRLVVAHPSPDDAGKSTYPAAENAAAVAAAGLDRVVTWRERSSGIAHNKFLVLTRDGHARAVWTGSTNITDGAFYGQSNVAHLVRGPQVAGAFLAYWKELSSDPTTPALRTFDERSNPVLKGEPERRSTHPIFSPHRGEGALRWLAARMQAARRSLFFTAPFGVSATLETFLLAPHEFAAYVLLDKGDNHMDLLRAAGNELTAGAYLGKGAWHQFLREALVDHLNNHVRFVHTKYALIDPLGSDPVVITGSANFSAASVAENDENMLVIRGNQRVADIYLTEFMRLFTHMYFRSRTIGDSRDAGTTPAPTPRQNAHAPLSLSPTDEWHRPWFDPADAHGRERLTFR